MASVRACLLLCVLAKTSGVGNLESGRSMPCFAGFPLPFSSKMGSGLPVSARRCGRPRAGQYLCSVARPTPAGIKAVTAQERATQIAETCITRDVVERLDRTGVAIVDHEMFHELATAVLVGAQRFLSPYPSSGASAAAMGVRGTREISQLTAWA